MSRPEYLRKRNFMKTPEPKGKGRAKSSSERIFVVQEHHASHLHWDFRLEAYGTLKSWAVPKGPSTVTGEKRLAVEVEDHPLSYANFHGKIPKGQYGAGTVKIWDRGTWTPPKNMTKAFAKGHLEFELHGKKLKGKYHLIRTDRQSGSKPQWLLMKGKEEEAIDGKISLSRASRAKKPFKHADSKAEISSPPTRGRAQGFLKNVSPQLATLVKAIPDGDQWLYEIKLDGYRTLALKNRQMTLQTRNGLDWTDKYQVFSDELQKCPFKNFILDGEVIVRDSTGRSDFGLLKEALSKDLQKKMEYCIFDILYLDGKSLIKLPLLERKILLEDFLKKSKFKNITYSAHQVGNAKALFSQTCSLGLEGLIAKDPEQSYEMRRTTSWLKIKCDQRQEFIIVGYTEPQGSRLGFGALLLGYYEGKELRFAGKVGTGFNFKSLLSLKKILKSLEIEKSFLKETPRLKNIHWVKPQLVCEVEYREWKDGSSLRHPSFLGLREDKKAREVTREISQDPSIFFQAPAKFSQKSKIKPALRTTTKSSSVSNRTSLVDLSSPDRVLYEFPKIYKKDVFSYYEVASELFLKYSANRPLAILRCQQTAQARCFFQKHLENTKTTEVYEGQVRDQKFMYLQNKTGLLQLVQSGAIEFHDWQSDVAYPNSPREMIFDLDPDEGLSWRKLQFAVLSLRDLLLELGLASVVKSTGGKGLHIHVSLQSEYSFELVKEFARSVCALLEKESPKRYTVNMSKAHREGKIFLDYLRNGFGATAIAPYSLRAGQKPTVALPLSWKEVEKMSRRKVFLIGEAQERLLEDDPWNHLIKPQKIRILESEDIEIFKENVTEF